MKNQGFVAWFLLAVALFAAYGAFAENKTAAAPDAKFKKFFNEFQSAVAGGDKEKVADLTEYPLGGDEFVFKSDDGKRIYSNDRIGFVAFGYDRLFDRESVKRLKKVKSSAKGRIDKFTTYEFKPLPELEREGYLPSYIERGAQGYCLTVTIDIPEAKTRHEDESAVMYYFVDVKGVYKFYAVGRAG